MRPLRDPEGIELSHLVNAIQIDGKNILEIGCGDGKFTFQYSGIARKVFGIDPEISELKIAKRNQRSLNTYFIQSKAESLPLPTQNFDIVIFASSL
jgi:ubiquinone/menaquinone biosynthesis C-methylase UbiE